MERTWIDCNDEPHMVTKSQGTDQKRCADGSWLLDKTPLAIRNASRK